MFQSCDGGNKRLGKLWSAQQTPVIMFNTASQPFWNRIGLVSVCDVWKHRYYHW